MTAANKQTYVKYPYYFIVPALVLFFIFIVLPTLMGFFYAFTDWNIYNSNINFIGFRNFNAMITEKYLGNAFKNTIVYSTGAAVLQNLYGLFLAVALTRKLKSVNFFRTVFFIPRVLSALVVGYIFVAVLHPNGLFNNILSMAGIITNIQWLADYQITLYVIIAVNAWYYTGTAMIIYIAAIKSIPIELVDSAKIDGAGSWGVFKEITFPLIASAFTINVTLSLIGALKAFELVFVLTGGGPGRSTEIMNTYIYSEYSQGRYGYATAVGLFLFLFVCAVALPIIKVLRKREIEYE